jgi:hypothetical protein
MKTIVFVAAVAAFEFAFVASIATLPAVESETVTVVQPRTPIAERLAAGAPVPCTPPG